MLKKKLLICLVCLIDSYVSGFASGSSSLSIQVFMHLSVIIIKIKTKSEAGECFVGKHKGSAVNKVFCLSHVWSICLLLTCPLSSVKLLIKLFSLTYSSVSSVWHKKVWQKDLKAAHYINHVIMLTYERGSDLIVAKRASAKSEGKNPANQINFEHKWNWNWEGCSSGSIQAPIFPLLSLNDSGNKQNVQFLDRPPGAPKQCPCWNGKLCIRNKHKAFICTTSGKTE